MSGRQVPADAEALAVVLALFPDPVRSDRLGDYRPEVAEAIQTLRDALAQPADDDRSDRFVSEMTVHRTLESAAEAVEAARKQRRQSRRRRSAGEVLEELRLMERFPPSETVRHPAGLPVPPSLAYALIYAEREARSGAPYTHAFISEAMRQYAAHLRTLAQPSAQEATR